MLYVQYSKVTSPEIKDYWFNKCHTGGGANFFWPTEKRWAHSKLIVVFPSIDQRACYIHSHECDCVYMYTPALIVIEWLALAATITLV